MRKGGRIEGSTPQVQDASITHYAFGGSHGQNSIRHGQHGGYQGAYAHQQPDQLDRRAELLGAQRKQELDHGLEPKPKRARRVGEEQLAPSGLIGVLDDAALLGQAVHRIVRRHHVVVVLGQAGLQGIDPFLTVLDAQRSYYAAQQLMVQTKLTAAQNLVAIYQTIGGDTLLQATPVCQQLPGDTGAAATSPFCSPR